MHCQLKADSWKPVFRAFRPNAGGSRRANKASKVLHVDEMRKVSVKYLSIVPPCCALLQQVLPCQVI